VKSLLFIYEHKETRRADLRTADLLQLRVIIHALQGFAQPCKSRISKRLSLLRVASCCTVLRSRWCQKSVGYTSPGPLRPMGK
jgi:hypothetical protein